MTTKKTYTQEDVIATNQSNYPMMALVYDFEYGIDDKVVAAIGSAMTDSSDSVATKKPRKYKLYSEGERNYFKKDGFKFYLDETMRTNF